MYAIYVASAVDTLTILTLVAIETKVRYRPGRNKNDPASAEIFVSSKSRCGRFILGKIWLGRL